MKRIGILTRDCAGVNAAIRASVRTAAAADLEVRGILRGYEGLIEGDFVPLDRRSVSSIINLGGTILKSARSERFFLEDGQKKALENFRKEKLGGLVVIGGNGSLSGAHVLGSRYGIPVIGIPATIDNDVNGVYPAIGADTATNVALDALDKIRDTATSLERIFVVEVMGRGCGYIAMQVALAGGCEEVLLPEKDIEISTVCREIREARDRGKISWIVIVAEGKATAATIADIINRDTGFETRIAVLGHLQRGGRPTASDRILASRLGHAAIQALMDGQTDRCVHIENGSLALLPLETAIQPKTIDIDSDYRLMKILS